MTQRNPNMDLAYSRIRSTASDFINGSVTHEQFQRPIEQLARFVRRDVTGVLLEHYEHHFLNVGRETINFATLGRIAGNYRVDKVDEADGDLRRSVEGSFEQVSEQLESPLDRNTASSIGIGIAYWHLNHLRRVLRDDFANGDSKIDNGDSKINDVIEWVRFKILSWATCAPEQRSTTGSEERTEAIGVLTKEEEQRIVSRCRIVVQRAGDELRRGIPEIESTIPNHDAIAKSLRSAADICDQPRAWVGIAIPYLIRSSDNPDYPSSLKPDLVDTWIVARLIRYIADEIWQWDLMADVHIPAQGNNLFQFTSSAHAFPSPIGRRNGGISVAKNHFSGGAAIAVEAPVFNTRPTGSSNTHHSLEQEPRENIAVPILLNRGYGLVYCAVGKNSQTTVSVADPQVQAVILGLADEVRRVLEGPAQGRSWIANLQTAASYCDLKNDIKERVNRFSEDKKDFSLSGERDVYHVVIAVPSRNNVVCTPLLRDLARRRALLKAQRSGSKVYELSQPGWFVFPTNSMMELDWQEYRDQNDWPIELYQANDVSPPILAGVIAEYKLTFQDSDMSNEFLSWKREGKDDETACLEITENIIDGLGNVGKHVMLFNKLRKFSWESNYHGALATVNELYGLLGHGCRCSIVLHDVSRFALHCGFFRHASEFAEQRMAIAPWELTAHSNLLLGLAAGRRVKLFSQHIEGCEQCQYYQQNVLFGREPDLNPLLTAAMSICLMSHEQPPKHREMLERRFADALTQLASHWEVDRRRVCQNILGSFAIKDFSMELQQKLTDDSWTLHNINESHHWREIDMLKRIVLAALGAYRGTRLRGNVLWSEADLSQSDPWDFQLTT